MRGVVSDLFCLSVAILVTVEKKIMVSFAFAISQQRVSLGTFTSTAFSYKE